MTRIASVALVLAAACGTTPTSSTPQTLTFEAYSAPQATSRDVFVGGRGDVVVMSNRISRDGGATWRPLDPRLGQLTRVAVTGTTVTLYTTGLGLARWDLASDAVTPVAGAPAAASDRTWRVDPVSGKLFVFDPVQNAIAVEGAGAFATAVLPQPTATEPAPYIYDLESNGATVMTVSGWGVHRSLDGGATWELVEAVPGGGRDLLALADGRFLLFGGATSYVFDRTGAATGSLPGVTADLGDASACDDGAIVVHDKLSRDLGATWQPLIPSGDLTPIVERVGCAGGRYWLLARSDAWGYRLVAITPATGALAAGNWEGTTTWAAGGPQITRSADGTFLVAGLAWHDGDAAWHLREIPPRAWASGDMAFGVTKNEFFASHDLGATWTARPQSSLAVDQTDAFARGADGTLLVSTFTGGSTSFMDAWHASVWKSSDEGATWTPAYDASAERVGAETTGEVHRFVGLAPDGAWVATDAVSRDGGATWSATKVKTDHSAAFITPAGQLVATLPTGSAADDVWRVYDRGGEGDLLATYHLDIGGDPIAASALGSVAFDEAGYAYVAGGSPYVQVWRSTQPID